jgi:soluble lytic murein transglycosylase-like protein
MGYTKFDISVPQVNKYFVSKGGMNYSAPNTISAHKKMIEEIDKNYGTLIEKWAKVFDIDKGIIISFIATESGGKNVGANKFKAVGLMQVTPNTVYEVITKWSSQVSVPLSATTKTFLNSKVSTTTKWSSSRVPTSAETTQILAGLTNTDYNIAVGTATIRWMLEAFAKLGVGGLDKVMVAYNAGYYGMRNKVKNSTIDEIIKNTNIPSESRAYVLKMMGVNGFMDLYYNIMDK